MYWLMGRIEGRAQYMCDDPADIALLPTTGELPGASCRCISDGSRYVLGGDGTNWTEYASESTAGGAGQHFILSPDELAELPQVEDEQALDIVTKQVYIYKDGQWRVYGTNQVYYPARTFRWEDATEVLEFSGIYVGKQSTVQAVKVSDEYLPTDAIENGGSFSYTWLQSSTGSYITTTAALKSSFYRCAGSENSDPAAKSLFFYLDTEESNSPLIFASAGTRVPSAGINGIDIIDLPRGTYLISLSAIIDGQNILITKALELTIPGTLGAAPELPEVVYDYQWNDENAIEKVADFGDAHFSLWFSRVSEEPMSASDLNGAWICADFDSGVSTVQVKLDGDEANFEYVDDTDIGMSALGAEDSPYVLMPRSYNEELDLQRGTYFVKVGTGENKYGTRDLSKYKEV